MRQVPLFRPVYLPEMTLAADQVLRSGAIASGPYVESFAQAFAQLICQDHAVPTSDMSSALSMALVLAGVRPGDEVLASPFSCLSSNTPISHVGALPVWVDVDPRTGQMCPDSLRSCLSSSTKAVLLYHLAGYVGQVEEISAVCREAGIPLIEDCNNALLASKGASQVGTFGDYAVFSLYPTRQINGIEGGVLTVRSEADAMRARKLRRFGIDAATFRNALGEINADSDVPEIGWSAAFNNLNAAVALAQLPTLSERLERTRYVAASLRDGLADVPDLNVVAPLPDTSPSCWTLLCQVGQPSTHMQVIAGLKKAGVHASQLHHRTDRYSGFNTQASDLQGLSHWVSRQFSLPCGWWMDDEDVSHVVEACHQILTAA